ncbi:MAG: hypothetical protein NT023_17590 [Armatimonadetes bacterium]|nr:hypothetical protein [Armatimonadota bacterium]
MKGEIQRGWLGQCGKPFALTQPPPLNAPHPTLKTGEEKESQWEPWEASIWHRLVSGVEGKHLFRPFTRGYPLRARIF